MVSLEGIVTKCSLVRPKVVQSVHYVERKDRFVARKYRDQTMGASGATSLNVYPQEDDEKNPVSPALQFLPNSLETNDRFSSLSPNTVTQHILTTSRFPSKKCPNVPRQDSCPEVSM